MRRAIIAAAVLLCLANTSAAQSAGPVVEYYHLDAVGSVRAVTDQQGQVIRRHDYHPFGAGDGVAAGTDSLRFTGKERDPESGLDYFGARYYAQRTGRFTTVDPILDIESALVEPQLWNRYAYVTNNPFRFRDPDGRQRDALDHDIRALLAKQITVEEYNARIQARGVGALVGVAPYALPALSAAIENLAANLLLRFELWHATAALGGGITARGLERLAESGGSTVRVLTNQDQALQAGRGFSAAVGEGAEALANAARSGPGVRTFVADLPKALVDGLVRARLLETSQTAMRGVMATEYRFLPGATQYIMKFFRELPQ